MRIQLLNIKQQVFFFFIVFTTTYASYAQKKPLDHSVYDSWQSIGSAGISANGNFIFYTITPQEGDALPRITTAKNQLLGVIERGTKARFSADERFLIAMVKPLFEEIRTARIEKKKAAEMPKDSLVIVNLETTDRFTAPNVTSYKLPQETGEYVTYISERQPEKSDDTLTKKPVPVLHIRHLPSGE